MSVEPALCTCWIQEHDWKSLLLTRKSINIQKRLQIILDYSHLTNKFTISYNNLMNLFRSGSSKLESISPQGFLGCDVAFIPIQPIVLTILRKKDPQLWATKNLNKAIIIFFFFRGRPLGNQDVVRNNLHHWVEKERES